MPATELHDDKGKFKSGNPGGPGNPDIRNAKAKGVELRRAWESAITPAQVWRIAERLMQIVDKGEDRDACKAGELILNRLFGKPAQQIEITDESPRKIRLAFVPKEMAGGTDARSRPDADAAERAGTDELPAQLG